MHELRLPLERISPAAAPGRHHAYELILAHRLAVNEAAEIARRAFYIHGHTERPARFASVEPITAEPHPIGGHDRAAVDQRTIMFFIAQAAAPPASPSRVRAQCKPLHQQGETGFCEFCRLVAGIRDDVDRIIAVGIIAATRTAAEHFT